MWRVEVVLGCVGLVTAGYSACPAAAQDELHPRPVLVELFTSEGCSSCPPADKLLALLEQKQPDPAVRVVVLSEHVTYWNHDGWKDPFSFEEMTDRQKDYVRRFGLKDSFTPQIVVDGTSQLVGTDVHALQSALDNAAVQPKQDLTIADARWSSAGVEFSVHAKAEKDERLMVVLAADQAHERVTSGENKGRTLDHVAVVRVIKEFGGGSGDGRALRLDGGPLTHNDEASGAVRLVVFLVDAKNGHVAGVAEQTLPR